MVQYCPFLSQLPEHEQLAWIEQLNQQLPDVSVVLANHLSLKQKQLCKIAIVANPEPSDFAEFPNLVWVQSLWAGVERLVAELDDPVFAISRLIDPTLAITMAEAVLAWTLYLHRDMPTYLAQQQAEVWQQHPYISSSERTIGVLGLGELGLKSAHRLITNGFNVIGWSRRQKQLDNINCYSSAQGLIEVIKQADIIVCLLPLTPATHYLINNELMLNMRKGCSIINFARGGVICTKDLLNQLDIGHISHAVLDVFEQEPLDSNSKLWHHPNITILPHVSAPTNIITASKIVVKNINNFINTGRLPACIDQNKGY